MKKNNKKTSIISPQPKIILTMFSSLPLLSMLIVVYSHSSLALVSYSPNHQSSPLQSVEYISTTPFTSQSTSQSSAQSLAQSQQIALSQSQLARIPELPQQINCFCNVCGTEVNSCNLSLSHRSQCYKVVYKLFNETGQYHYKDTQYGCLNEQEGHLSSRQCHLKMEFNPPVAFECCRNENDCNLNLDDPDPNDPRWKNVKESRNFDIQTEQPTYILELAIIICIAIFCIASISVARLRSISSRRSASSSSTCTSKADLEKSISYFLHINQSQSNNPSSSNFSAHTYHSSTDDPCRKPDLFHEPTNILSVELTSGLGEHMLNRRTIAQSIHLGKKDHVGSGRFGHVFRASYHDEDVAVKAFRTVDQESWQREDMIFRYLNHDNIVRFIASEVTAFVNASEIWMFLEYCPFGSLCDYLETKKEITPERVVKLLYSVINGLNYLHEDYGTYKPSIAHRDIKSKNILMRTEDICCIADFGHALLKIEEGRLDYGKYPNLHVGTVRYMAPEILRTNTTLNYQEFSTFAKADLYQYSLVMWEVCNRTSQYRGDPVPKHQLPYDEIVPTNPSVDDMIKLVCDDQYRPSINCIWRDNLTMSKLSELMVENWRHNPNARMETLGVKRKLKGVLDEITPNYHLESNLRLTQHGHRYPESKSDKTM